MTDKPTPPAEETDGMLQAVHGSVSSEPLHVYDWLDLPAADENERLAKEWLNKFSKPAYDKYKSGAGEWLAAHALTVEWRGQRYWCRGCSRMGDVWITKDPTGATYYDHRVNVEELSNWKRFDDARGNLQHNAIGHPAATTEAGTQQGTLSPSDRPTC